MDTGAYSSWGCSACVMDFFGYVLRVLADDCTGGKRPGLGDVANEALNVWPCCESPVPIREVVPSALSGLPERLETEAIGGCLPSARLIVSDPTQDWLWLDDGMKMLPTRNSSYRGSLPTTSRVGIFLPGVATSRPFLFRWGGGLPFDDSPASLLNLLPSGLSCQ